MSSIQISEIDQCMNLLRESERERECVRVCARVREKISAAAALESKYISGGWSSSVLIALS